MLDCRRVFLAPLRRDAAGRRRSTNPVARDPERGGNRTSSFDRTYGRGLLYALPRQGATTPIDGKHQGSGAKSVPQIDTPLLLDILLGLIILLFVPFGIRRGVAKEAMVSAGVLLGATLAERFGADWGAELTTRFGLEQGPSTFAASAALLLACTFLLGYGGGAALGRSRPGTASRLAGGLLAAFNAAFLLSTLFGWIDEYLQQGAALDDGIVGEALLRRADLLLLGAAGVLLVLTVLGWIVNASRSRRQPRESNGSLMGGIPARQRPVRMANDGDAGKYEPEPEPVSRSGRFGQGIEATSPLPLGATYAEGEPWPRDGQATPATNGHNRSGQVEGTRQRALDAPQARNDETVWSPWSAAADDTVARTEAAGPWPVTSARGVTDDERCAVCRARVGPRDVFCPECGATL
ncbi:MAG: Colicin production protein [Thermomicrobiales bacterium]|nr:Colicin production protein [Thermomicrobiales bacterium]